MGSNTEKKPWTYLQNLYKNWSKEIKSDNKMLIYTFFCRRHTKNLRGMENLPPVEIDGYLERKQELQAGGKRATIRSWKSYYSVLCGQLLCFFRDQEDFLQSKAASSPIMIHQVQLPPALSWFTRYSLQPYYDSPGTVSSPIMIHQVQYSKEIKSDNFCYHKVGKAITKLGAIEKSPILLSQSWKNYHF